MRTSAVGARKGTMTRQGQIDVRVDREAWKAALGADPARFARRVLRAAAKAEGADGDVSVAFSDDKTVAALNKQWRKKDKPTNVLSFPAAGEGELGDIILALETIETEADAQGKTIAAHAAHLLTHGFLHLLGYDHEQDDEAEDMEAREREIMDALGFGDPYADSQGETRHE